MHYFKIFIINRRNLSLNTDNLIAYYPFHNSAEDVHGNYDGTAYFVTGTTNRHGEANKAYKYIILYNF